MDSAYDPSKTRIPRGIEAVIKPRSRVGHHARREAVKLFRSMG